MQQAGEAAHPRAINPGNDLGAVFRRPSTMNGASYRGPRPTSRRSTAMTLASAAAAPSFTKPVDSSRGRAPRADFRHHGPSMLRRPEQHQFDAINMAAQLIRAAKLNSYAFIQLASIHRSLLRLFLMRKWCGATREPYIVPASGAALFLGARGAPDDGSVALLSVLRNCETLSVLRNCETS
jgi:hypothetical protein